VIDLAGMRSVRVDPEARRAWVSGGATLGDFDHEAQAFGLATPVGINSTTGIAGLTLGGGFGWLSRQYGLSCDNLVGADVVTADGRMLRADAKSEPDLFWALRGGSGNFGIVTTFEFALHKVGPEVTSGLVVYPFAQAAEVLRAYRDFAAGLPDHAAAWVVARRAPPLPFLASEVHGKEVIVIAVFHAGDPREAATVLAPAKKLGKPVGEHVGPMPYAAWQQAFDPLLTEGARNYWKSHNFAQLDDGVFDALVEYTQKLPSPHCEIFIGQLGGKTSRVASDATAYAHRDADFVMNVHGRWETPAEDERCIAWSRAFYEATAKWATGGVYVNFLSADEQQKTQAAYGKNFERLARLKARYDPQNFFRTNLNVAPAR
jgi:FAD/FMN-containing dehydrogenase